jgi:hypothetical protein
VKRNKRHSIPLRSELLLFPFGLAREVHRSSRGQK